MNQQRDFPLAGLVLTIGTPPDAHVRIRIEHKAMLRWQFAKLGFLAFAMPIARFFPCPITMFVKGHGAVLS
jgi:hypothetical protein